jgi:DNA polymerase-3 subunit gamma/tau
MSEYQVLARKYRPQTFAEVLGQDAIVTTLKNAIKQNRLAHGYLFCGSRGTGKTTLARVFAKALNCQSPSADFEPCNTCSSCREITFGHSLDVMEIDGASHRGIDDIRQINENVGYTPSCGKYKIYIIDEVHMLTKEAFNALLKTLEEPPAKVKFFFATTEPHKVLPTILSRCQRFNLNRIPTEEIISKLKKIAIELSLSIDDDALRLLAIRADGGLRDAESLLDQIMAFNEGNISAKTIADVLGIMPKEQLYKLDQAGKDGNIAFAFELAHQIFSEGKDILHFVENLNEHIRNILMVKISGKNAPFLNLSEAERDQYEISAKIYSQEQCVTILEFLIEAQNQIRYMASPRIALEALLIRIIRTHQRVPVDFLIKRLAELEEKIMMTPKTAPQTTPLSQKLTSDKPETYIKPVILKEVINEKASITEDPTPTPADLGIRTKKIEPVKAETVKPVVEETIITKPVENVGPKPPVQNMKHITMLQFAAVELEGIIIKNK